MSMVKLVLFLVVVFCIIGSASATTYNWYFATAGDDTTGDGSIGDPWETVAKADTKVNDANSGDIVYLYFNRGDTWTANTAAVSTESCYGVDVGSADPIVHINAYGGGNIPIFDGLVSDFSSVPEHNSTTGPVRWNSIFEINRHDCTVQNVEIKQVYGSGIQIKDANELVVSNSYIHDIGSFAMGSNTNFDAINLTADSCTVHTIQELYRYGKRSGWGGGIQFANNQLEGNGSVIKNCVVYDIYGEGLIIPNGIAEYNIVANTWSVAIDLSPYKMDAENTTVRYNLIIMEDWSTHIYDQNLVTGIRVFDEQIQGDNSNGNMFIYGNTVINYGIAFKMYNDLTQTSGPYNSVHVYNNLFIDSHTANTRISDHNTPPSVINLTADFQYYNNVLILYDQTGSSHVTDSIDSAYFGAATIENNSYWTTGGSPTVDSNWDTNYTTTNPLLPGEPSVDWDGQTGADYYKNITIEHHLFPASNSPLWNAGKVLGSEFNSSFLTKASNYSTLTDVVNFTMEDQGALWNIGPFVNYSAGAGAPNITTWENNKTSNNTLDITINTSESVNFNATANQTITTWNWYKDDADQSNNYDNISLSWSTSGLKHVIVNATNTNGTSPSITWNVTVESLVDTSYFTYHKIITINQSMVNQSIGTETYPMLVSTTDTDLANSSQADGDDIVFFDSDNTTQLPYEQEFWNSTNGELVEWVGIEDIKNVSYIVMWYNNSTIANSENATGVWDSDYLVVHHLQETDIDGGAGDIKDSTLNHHNGTTYGMTGANQISGQIDGSFNIDGAGDSINLSSPATLDDINPITISCWIESSGVVDDDRIYTKDNTGVDGKTLCVRESTDNFLEYRSAFSTTDGRWTTPTDSIVPDTRYHIYITHDNSNTANNAVMYINGSSVAVTESSTPDGSASSDAAIDAIIGNRPDGVRPWNYIIDEFRISESIRSAEYAQTDYNNTAYPSLFISIGAEQGDEGAPDTKFEYWDGSTWQENPEDYHLWFECFWITSEYPDGVAPNAEQTGSQHSLKITNNGTAAGIPKMKFNESSPAEVTVYVDDDYTVAGAVAITDTYQAVSTSLNAGENVTLSAWVNLTGLTSIWEYETEVIVE